MIPVRRGCQRCCGEKAADILPFVFDQLLLSICQPEEPILVDSSDVTGAEPALLERRFRLLGVVLVAPDLFSLGDYGH